MYANIESLRCTQETNINVMLIISQFLKVGVEIIWNKTEFKFRIKKRVKRVSNIHEGPYLIFVGNRNVFITFESPSAPNPPFTSCFWDGDISPLPGATVWSLISKGCYRDTVEGRGFTSWSNVLFSKASLSCAGASSFHGFPWHPSMSAGWAPPHGQSPWHPGKLFPSKCPCVALSYAWFPLVLHQTPPPVGHSYLLQVDVVLSPAGKMGLLSRFVPPKGALPQPYG